MTRRNNKGGPPRPLLATPAEAQALELANANVQAQNLIKQMQTDARQAWGDATDGLVQGAAEGWQLAQEIARCGNACAQRAHERIAALLQSPTPRSGPALALALYEAQLKLATQTLRSALDFAQGSSDALARRQAGWWATWTRDLERMQRDLLRGSTDWLLRAEDDATVLSLAEGRPQLAAWWNELRNRHQAAVDSLARINGALWQDSAVRPPAASHRPRRSRPATAMH